MCKNIESILSEKGRCVINTNGDSMWPTIKSGRDKILILPPENISKNDIVLFKNNNTFTLHRVIKICDGFLITRGDNYNETEKISFDKIIGKADGIYGKKKFYSCNSLYIKSKYFIRRLFSPLIIFYRKRSKKHE